MNTDQMTLGIFGILFGGIILAIQYFLMANSKGFMPFILFIGGGIFLVSLWLFIQGIFIKDERYEVDE